MEAFLMSNIIYDNLDKFVIVILLIGISIFIRILLQILGQSWIKTVAHTATLSLLPILTYIITSVISGNIALSLGMVGALSIVRFRNPVRSPLELSVYFGSITMGIAAAVSLKWLMLLVGSVLLVAITLWLLNILCRLVTGTSFFMTSFSEGNSLSTLDVTANCSIESLDHEHELISKQKTENQFSYVLASSNFDRLRAMESNLAEDPSVVSLQLNK